jgi:hypothetical protein
MLEISGFFRSLLRRTNPMRGKRRRYGGDFKAKVVLEALRGELTTAQLATKHGIHHAWYPNGNFRRLRG